ncbi:DUF1232 domain-containing protein [Oscillatoriales cyanobacterium LEGE 11467]|uniref:DUF1232 domain-containing protein n=1 Tax=Zarconia navalis LEGE 11467 TaxID=1828826 RepID=A0A928VWX1_9CYAN|nr:YkvA family protein [Zarconia navalis]MBE9040247.1 DUF1232 domain-containing protein [Zarconia navalis LEGE 11467]
MKKNFMQSFLTWYRNTLRNPKYRWWIVFGTFAYLVSPIDISPDLFPIVGQVDDVAILMLLLSEVYQIATDWIQARGERAVASDSTQSGQTPSATVAEKTVEVDAVSLD